MVVLVSRKARQVEDDNELDIPLVRAAELQQLLQLGAVGGLRALPFLAESREHVEALALAVLLAGLQLGRQTQVLGLLLGADAHVDHRADHVRQHRPAVRRSQVRAHALVNRRALLVEEHLDHGLSYGVGTAADSIDLVVAQVDRFLAEQLATPLHRDLVVGFAGWKDLVHRNALHNLAMVVVVLRSGRRGICRDVPVNALTKASAVITRRAIHRATMSRAMT
ncbi:MAG TPA: hypothetical protein VGI12_16705 [Vicinamibacterales bacterium]